MFRLAPPWRHYCQHRYLRFLGHPDFFPRHLQFIPLLFTAALTNESRFFRDFFPGSPLSNVSDISPVRSVSITNLRTHASLFQHTRYELFLSVVCSLRVAQARSVLRTCLLSKLLHETSSCFISCMHVADRMTSRFISRNVQRVMSQQNAAVSVGERESYELNMRQT